MRIRHFQRPMWHIPPYYSAPAPVVTSDQLKEKMRKDAADIRKRAFFRMARTAPMWVRDKFLRGIRTENTGCVSAYWPLAEELDPRPTLEALMHNGAEACLPVMRARAAPLEFHQWQPGAKMKRAAFGVMEPKNTPQCVPDIVIVPLLAFGRDGSRLGYGGGFYDRTIAGLRRGRPVLCVGMAFSVQERDDIPMDAHDQYLDMVVTEKEVIEIQSP